MRLLPTLYTRGVYPAVNPHLRGLGGRLAGLRRWERASLEQNRERQWRSLQQMLQHAFATTAFYRRRFEEAGLRPADIQAEEDLRRLPPLTRADIREQESALRSNRFAADRLLPAATGGTTDTPVRIWRDWDAVGLKLALQTILNEWAGARPGDRTLYLWGARADYPTAPSWRWRLYDRYLMRREWAPISLINPDIMEGWRRQLNRLRPAVIYAYPTPLAVFCQFLRDCSKPYWQPRTVICTAEALLPEHRQLMEAVLGCPVFEHYGSREFGMVGAECEAHQGLHLHPAAVYVEAEPMPGAGEGLRELLITDLFNRGMPLIRYRVNDCVAADMVLAPCSCGRGFVRAPGILGRSGDIFYLPDGAAVPGVALTNRVIQVMPGLSKIQIIQEERARFRLRYVPGRSFQPSDMEALRRKLGEFLPGNLIWELEAVSDIEREASGKTRLCISRVSAPGRSL